MLLMGSPRLIAIPPRHSAARIDTAAQTIWPSSFILRSLALKQRRGCGALSRHRGRSRADDHVLPRIKNASQQFGFLANTITSPGRGLTFARMPSRRAQILTTTTPEPNTSSIWNVFFSHGERAQLI